RRVGAVVEPASGNQLRVPHRVHVAGRRPRRIAAARRRTEEADRNPVAAALDAAGVPRLVQIADEVHEELEGDRAVGTIEARVGDALLVIADAIDDAVPPDVAAGADVD